MLLIGIGWLYVVLMVALVELTAADGSWLGALATLVFWGFLPLTIGGYLLLAPARRRRRKAAEAASALPTSAPASGSAPEPAPVPAPTPAIASAVDDPDQRGHPPGDAVASVRVEP